MKDFEKKVENGFRLWGVNKWKERGGGERREKEVSVYGNEIGIGIENC